MGQLGQTLFSIGSQGRKAEEPAPPAPVAPRVGLEFEHTRYLSTEAFDGKTPQVMRVTRIARGVVYYRPVYGGGDVRVRLGSPLCCDVAEFGRWCKAEAVPA